MQRTQSKIEVKDGELLGRALDPRNKEEMKRAREFRHGIFLDELGWSLPESSAQEVDEYDRSSVHFGAFSEAGELIGYCRLILPEGGFMIEREFTDLVYPNYHIRKERDTVEISHFAIPKGIRSKIEGFKVVELLLRCVYQLARSHNIRYIYGVCASEHLVFVQAAFSCCKAIGPGYEYQHGVSSSALIVDLDKLDVAKVQEFWSGVVGKPRAEQ